MDFKRSLIATVLWLLLVLPLSGCVSSQAHLAEWNGSGDFGSRSVVYSGTCHSFLILSNHDHGDGFGEVLAALTFFDLPATIALDTILLPLDLTADAYSELRDRPSKQSICDVLTGS